MPAAEVAPAVSFGVPVRNGIGHLPRLLDSLLAQTFSDLEVVVCDNASDDGTQDLVRRFAQADPRIRLHVNPTNIGQIENFNRVLELARGTYFRWIGADDWLEPEYTAACLECFRSRPEVIAVTTYQDHIDDRGHRHYVEYRGPRLESHRASARAARMMWFLHADLGFIDPIYTIARRDVLLRTRRLQIVPSMDQVLALEIALLGPFGHVPRCLSHRAREYLEHGSEAIRARYHPTRYAELKGTTARLVRAFLAVVAIAPLSPAQRLWCRIAVWRWGARHLLIRTRVWLRRLASRILRPLRRRRATTAKPPVNAPEARPR